MGRDRTIAVLNAGTATLKVAVLAVQDGALAERYRAEQAWDGSPAAGEAALAAALTAVGSYPDAVGHRVVHGGLVRAPALPLDATVEQSIETWLPQAPAHNGRALGLIAASRRQLPNVPAFAVFDSAFHSGRSAASMSYALPARLVADFALHRYGFHGSAHESLLHSAAGALGCSSAAVSAVTLQLGSGCSACAIAGGRSVEVSMGYSPLDGLVMGTRPGELDPGIVLRLLRAGLTGAELEEQLSRRSGLLALGGSADMREILARAATDAAARLAIDVFVHRLVLTVGGYFTLLDGQGVLVFGGGIGANSPEIRRRVGAGLAAWGIEVDPARNVADTVGRISTRDSRPVFVFRTDEEAVIARHVYRCLLRKEG